MERRVSIRRAVQVVDRPVFTTREIAALRDGSVAATSQALRRMEKEGVLVRATRGLWCIPADPRFTPFSLVPFLAGGHRAYVSFLSALHLHGVIEQIPRIVYTATTAHTHVQKTCVGTYSFHQIDPRFFAGFGWYRDGRTFLIATPEKALVDCLYLSSRRGKRFHRFPELELDRRFKMQRARSWVRRIPDSRIRTYTSEQLKTVVQRNPR